MRPVEDKYCDNLSKYNYANIKMVRLKDVCQLKVGGTPKTNIKEYWDNGTIPWMSSGEINKDKIYFTEKCITEKGFNNSNTKLLPLDTVIIALAGQGSTRGKVAITKIQLCTNQSLCGMIPNDKINSNFLYFYLQTQYLKLRDLSSGDGARGGLNLKIIGEFKIPFLPLLEQQKISSAFPSPSKV